MLPTTYSGDKSPQLKRLQRIISSPSTRKVCVGAIAVISLFGCAAFFLRGEADRLSGRRGVLHTKSAIGAAIDNEHINHIDTDSDSNTEEGVADQHAQATSHKPFDAAPAAHKPFEKPTPSKPAAQAAEEEHPQIKAFKHKPVATPPLETDETDEHAPSKQQQEKPSQPVSGKATSPPKATKQPTGELPTLSADSQKQAFVKRMFQHAWQGYRDFAWGADALRPVSKSSDNNFLHMGATAVDAMDTLLIMGLMDEYHHAEDWVLENLHFSSQSGVSVFETTIRVLGGLLAAYDLTETLMPVFGVDTPLSKRRPELLKRAQECADALKFAFKTNSGIPYGTVSLGGNARAFNPGWTGGMSSTAEAATLQLEWEYLALATGQAEYANDVRRTMQAFHAVEPKDHLLPIHIDPNTGKWGSSNIVTLGARGDSAYEYLVKQHVLSGGLDRKRHAWRGAAKDMPGSVNKAEQSAWSGAVRGVRGGRRQSTPLGSWAFQANEIAYFDAVRSMYDGTVHGIKDILVHQTTDGATETPLVFISERLRGRIDHKMDHLVCFAGGMLGLGARTAWGAPPPSGWDKASYLAHVKRAKAAGAAGEPHADADEEALLREQDADDMRLAAEITRTCHEMYSFTATKLAPEIVRFRSHEKGHGQVGAGGDRGLGMIVDPGAKHCLLRPEAVESFFVMFRLTGDERYREWGWEMAQAIEAKARIETGGYSSINDVTHDPPAYKDHQESFFLAETLKYLYLLFSDSKLIPLDKYVFNTEAHPLSIARGAQAAV